MSLNHRQNYVNDDIEDIIDNPAKFHQKLLETGIVDSDYLDFLNELDQTDKEDDSTKGK